MLTILIVTDNLPTSINGVVTTYRNIENIASTDGYRFVYLDPTAFIYFDTPGYPEVKISIPLGIGDKIRKINPDHIHIATEGSIGLAAVVWCRKNNVSFCSAYHTKFPEFLKKLYNIPEFITYSYVRWFHKHSSRILTTTTTMVDELKSNGFNGEIVAWTRGVDRSIFKRDLRKNFSSKDKILLSVGRVSKEKGLDDFCKLELPNYSKISKIIVGDGPYLSELQMKYKDVFFVGAKTGTELANYFANADVFVFTSRTDTFGIVIIESLSVGTPVAAFPVAGPIDIIEHGVSGHMSDNLANSVEACFSIDRNVVYDSSCKWTWETCWKIFKDNLI